MSRRAKQTGYTLVELVLVIGITTVLLMTSLALFYVTFIGGNKTASVETTKQAGQYAMGQIVRMLTSARRLLPNPSGVTCAAGMDAITFENQDLGVTTMASELDSTNVLRLASNSGIYISPGTVVVSAGPVFSCVQPVDGSAPAVTIQFTLRKGSSGTDKARDIVEIPFESQVTMRNNQ